jgi:hypothetical protein
MARTTPEKVKEITGSSLDDAQIQPFIDAASCIIDQAEACAIGRGISSDCLTQAETFLAAHLLSLSPLGQKTGTKKRETFENYTVEFAISAYTSEGVLSTSYGQAANALTGGCLQEVDKRQPYIGFFGGA